MGRFTGLAGIALIIAVGYALSRDRRAIRWGVVAWGFANIGSVGIQIGGIGALAPDRKTDLVRLGSRAMLAGTLANFLSAAIAGILL